MLKFNRLIIFLGIIVLIIGAILVFYLNNKKSLEFNYSMLTKLYDEKTGEVIMDTEKLPNHYFGLLQFKTKPNTKDMAQAIVCAEDISNVNKVDLYMPEMGHGSQPPMVANDSVPTNLREHVSKRNGFGCLKIENMQLFMPGLWQVRIFYKNGTVGLFHLDILE